MVHDLFSLQGQVALITGASRGLGAAMATALAEAGADVILHSSRTPAVATEAVIQAHTTVKTLCLTADLASRAETDRLILDSTAAMGTVDILINNAGIIRRTPAADHQDEDWDAVLEIDLTSPFRLARAAGRGMLAKGRGKIINVASLLSFQGGINVPAYSAAKGGIAQLTKALANEWAGRGITVNAIAPGYFHTDNTRALASDEVRNKQILDRIPAGRWGEPDDLKGAAIFLSSRASDYVNGHILIVDGGWMGR